jgi:transcriptional regulator with XRE-family HTH domain
MNLDVTNDNKMNEKELLWRLGQKIKLIRDSKNIKQVDLANSLDYDRSNMSRLESGRVNPRFITLIKVAHMLGVPVSEIIDIDYSETKKKK